MESLAASLTEIGDGIEDTRCRAPFTELIRNSAEEEMVKSVINILTRARLIVIGEKTAEVAHEALIREWPMLRRWVDANRAGLRIYRSGNSWPNLNSYTGLYVLNSDEKIAIEDRSQ